MKPVLRPTAMLLAGMLLAATSVFAQSTQGAADSAASRAAPDSSTAKSSPSQPPAAAAKKNGAKSAPSAGAAAPAKSGTQNAVRNSTASATATTAAAAPTPAPPLPDLGASQAGTPPPFARSDAAADAKPAAAEKSKRYPARFRLDDGKYKGFRQNDGDQPASGTSVEPATDRARVLNEPRPAPR